MNLKEHLSLSACTALSDDERVSNYFRRFTVAADTKKDERY